MAFKLFKTKLPTGQTKEMNEIESFTLTWKTRGYGYTDNPHYKVFTSEADALEYQLRLEDANQLLQTGYEISARITKN